MRRCPAQWLVYGEPARGTGQAPLLVLITFIYTSRMRKIEAGVWLIRPGHHGAVRWAELARGAAGAEGRASASH